jgi:hypothetical protein
MSSRLNQRIPKVQTALVPYSVSRNKQIVSVPSHATGLSIDRTIRLNVTTSTTSGYITYNAIRITFLQELGIQLAANASWSFTPRSVSMYGLSADTYTLGIYNAPHYSIDDEAIVNKVVVKAVDSCLETGIAHISFQIPQAAIYCIDDSSVKTLGAPFLFIRTEGDRHAAIIDINGQFTCTTGVVAHMPMEQNSMGIFTGTDDTPSDTDSDEPLPAKKTKTNSVLSYPELSSNLERISPPLIRKSYKMSRMLQHSI